MGDLQKQLEEQGFKYWNLVIGKTCKPELISKNEPPYDLERDYLYVYRGDQILEWLCTNEFKGKFLVIDDEISDICGSRHLPIPSRCVLYINGNEGMLHRDAMTIIEYFKKETSDEE